MLLDHAGFDRKARIVTILDEMMGGLEISPSQRELAQQRYEAAGRWLASSGVSMLRDLYIYLQGSTALGTTVKPIGHNEHDVDLVAHRPSYEAVEPAVLKKAIGDRLRENGHYASLLEEMPRCWRLVYANEFHMDITPAISNAQCSNGGELVPDKALRCWKASNPKGYKREFERRAALKPQFRLNKSLQYDAKRAHANVEPYPVATGFKGVLRRMVQIGKRHRASTSSIWIRAWHRSRLSSLLWRLGPMSIASPRRFMNRNSISPVKSCATCPPSSKSAELTAGASGSSGTTRRPERTSQRNGISTPNERKHSSPGIDNCRRILMP